MLTDYFYPQVGGGVEKVVYEISKRLTKMGCEVLVITLGNCRSNDVYMVENIKVCRIPSIDLSRVLDLQLSFPRSFREILHVTKTFSPDIIHAHNIFFTTSLGGVLIKQLHKQKFVVTAHLGDIQNLALVGQFKAFSARCYERSLGRIILASSDNVIAVSNSVQRHLVSIGVPSERITVIPNGVDLEEFCPVINTNRDDDQISVIFVGRLLPNKGLEYLIEAAKSVVSKRSSGIKFKIIGDGPHKAQFENLVKRNGLGDYFDFLGKIPRVSDVLEDGGIFVRPSLTEGMPLTVLEAMSCKLPVIATKVAGTQELIVQNETGLLVDPGNVQQLADAILYLVNCPEDAERLGHNARAFIECHYKERYSWETVASKMLSLYKSLG
jgi:glycosyltransferase involved in cell wall biosynthesis